MNQKQIKEVGNQNNNVINSVWKLYKRRWYILFIYSMVSMEQSIIWITFSPISDTAENYYGINDFQINLLLAWGTIIYIPFAFVSSYILKEKRGLRIVSLLGAFLAALGSSIRCLSILFPKKWYALYILTIGQILNAAVGPLVMSSPSKLSATWFGEQERTIATSIATLSNYFGSSVGFIIGPYIIQSYSLPILLIVEGIGSIIILVCIIIYFPEKPPTPPSPSASFSELDNNSFIFELKGLINQKSFILLSIIGGWSSGIYSIWSTMFNQILQPLHYSQIFSGWLGFASSVSGIVGGVILGILSDTILKRKFKIVLIILLSLSSILFIFFSLFFPSIISKTPIIEIHSLWLIIITATLGGLFLGSTNPLFLELGAEMTYPISEGSSASVIAWFSNIAGLIILIAGSFVPTIWINSLATISIIALVFLLFLIEEKYIRDNFDQKGYQILSQEDLMINN